MANKGKAEAFHNIFFPPKPAKSSVPEDFNYPEPLPLSDTITKEQITQHIKALSLYKVSGPDEIPVTFRITDPTPSPSPPEMFHRRIVDHQHYQSYAPFFCLDNSRLGPSPPAPYHNQNHHYSILWHFTCQRALSNTCIIIWHLRLWLRTEQILSGDTLKTLSPSRSLTIPPPPPPPLLLQLYIFPHTDDISTSSRHSSCIINQTQSEMGWNPAPTITILGNPIVVVFLHCSPIPLFVDVYSL